MESCSCGPGQEDLNDLMNRQRKILWAVMAINAAMFVIEVASGILAGSVALLSDAMDFFADTLTYGLTLYVIGRSTRWRTGAALLKGISLTVFAGVIFYQTVQHLTASPSQKLYIPFLIKIQQDKNHLDQLFL